MTLPGKALALTLMIATVGCDRVTKHLATANLDGKPAQSYFADTFRLVYAENAGAFLSLGAGLPEFARIALFTIGSGLALVAVAFIALQQRWVGLRLAGVALMLAGGFSNLVDRVIHGSVIDFMNIGVGTMRTGIFNVADVAVMLGLAVILVESLRKEDPNPG